MHTAHGEVSPVGGAAVVGADVVDDVVVEFSEANIIIFGLCTKSRLYKNLT